MEPLQYDIGSSGYVAAFRSVKAAKNIFMALLALAILVQLGSFVLVQFVGVIDDIQAKPVPAPQTQPASAPAGCTRLLGSATFWQELLHWTMPAMKFVAMTAGLLAVLTLMFAVKLALLGRLGGIGGFMSAFFWSIILLVMVTPWQQILRGEFASGALCNLGELIRWAKNIRTTWGAEQPSLLDQILYYGRFIAYPVTALLVWLAVQIKFSGGYKDSILSPVGTIPEQRPPEPKL